MNAATLKLFNKMVCKPGPNATTVDPSWKATVGYTEGGDQWDNIKGQIVSCDPTGTKYALGPAVIEGTQLTGVAAGLQSSSTQWVVNLTLNSAATASFGALTTSQYNTYYAQAESGDQDASALDSTAIVLDGNVQEAPLTEGALTSGSFTISGPQPDGFTEDQAIQLTNVLKYGSLPLNFVVQFVQLGLTADRCELAHRGADRRRPRPDPGDHLPLLLLPGPGHRLGQQPADRRAARLPLGGAAQQVPELHHVPVGDRRPRGGDRHHRGLVHRLLRTAP